MPATLAFLEPFQRRAEPSRMVGSTLRVSELHEQHETRGDQCPAASHDELREASRA